MQQKASKEKPCNCCSERAKIALQAKVTIARERIPCTKAKMTLQLCLFMLHAVDPHLFESRSGEAL